ncbi:adenine deaminase C-terminal domain-containing protein [Deinococcus sp. QL22]|uniref:adenine deaminase C-terminal domain-containing protein n=1 Tax=Deinococcus sp. QL22 TaxID=2939437 RepID=UPI0020181FA0|nr:adenine deaminase C-terminal domain-containing protein [Deinococcus sp. QL22]UQN08958.1 amidohydrolase family protein [Deinococcus sp. QL22]
MLDLLLTHARVFDVTRDRVFDGWLGIRAGRLQYVEEGEVPGGLLARQTRDLRGARVVPGLIDAHMHIESSLLTPRRFAEAVLPHGTTTVMTDPHELANVLGVAGVQYTLEASEGLPLRVYVAVPSCVPATSPDLETALGHIGADDVRRLALHPRVLALGEVMDYQGLAAGVTQLPALIEAAQAAGLLIEGHTPTLGGMVLSDYTAYGILSDHTLSTPEKLLEQLSKGYTVMLQEKSLNAEVVRAVLELPDRSRVLLVTDDVMPNRLPGGHLSRLVNLAASLGWPLVDAVAAASLRPAMYLGLRHVGLLAPGRAADLCVLGPGEDFQVDETYVNGTLVARQGRCVTELQAFPAPVGGQLLRPEVDASALQFGVSTGLHLTNTLTCNTRNTFTRLETVPVAFQDGWPVDPALNAVAVFTRQGSAPPGLGLLRGFGLQAGAFASTLAHDSHNLLVVGQSREDMVAAARTLQRAGGGMVYVRGDEVIHLPLEVAALISDAPLGEVAGQVEAIEAALRRGGVTHLHPILFLTILPLTVSPQVKVSDRGLVDVERRALLPLFP